MLRVLLASLGLLLISGCTLLTADAPLLVGADDGGFSLREGLWAMRDPQTCKLAPRRADPSAATCIAWARIERAGPGVWRIDSVPADEKGPYFIRVAAAGDQVYVGESVRGDEIAYLALVPGKAAGKPPFPRLHVQVIACEDMVHEGLAPPGIALETDAENGSITGCKVSDAGAAMAAAELTLRARPEMLDEAPIIFVRP